MKATERPDGRWVVFVPVSKGRRQQKYFPSRSKADQFIRDLEAERREHGRAAISLQERQLIAVVRSELGGDVNKLLEVLEHWKRTGRNIQQISVNDAVEKFIQYKKEERVRTDSISWILRKFVTAFNNKQIHQITAAEIDWFLRLQNEGWSRVNFFRRISLLFSHAVLQKWIVDNPITQIRPPSKPNNTPLIYDSEDFKKLLITAKDHDEVILIYFLFTGYLYLRHQELVRRYDNEAVAEWHDIDISKGEITVRQGVAKHTRRQTDERFVPISDILLNYIRNYVHQNNINEFDRVIPISVVHFRQRMLSIFKRSGVEFIDNGIRHSAISYTLAENPKHGVQLVASWAGNSETTIRKHYLRGLSQTEGKLWFSAIDVIST